MAEDIDENVAAALEAAAEGTDPESPAELEHGAAALTAATAVANWAWTAASGSGSAGTTACRRGPGAEYLDVEHLSNPRV